MRFVKTLAAVLGLGGAAIGCAQKETRVVQGIAIAADKAGLWASATLPADSAVRIALGAVPGGKGTKAELEEENGRLIYSFDLEVDGQEGEHEVHVDAKTGEVVKAESEKK
jgi:uncharacterized membrane protein YkoI